LNTFLIILAASMFLVAWGLLDWRRRWRLRAKFYAARSGLSDAGFLEETKVPSERGELCLAIRRGFAEMCGLPPEMILPGDKLEELSTFVFDNADVHDIALFVGKHLRTRIPSRTVANACEQVGGFKATLGEFALALSLLLQKEDRA
jgi:hypothetical protein